MIDNCQFTQFWVLKRHGGAIGRCLYCGRRFCPNHGSRYEDGTEICWRPICQDKRTELPRYQEYRLVVQGRNSSQSCGAYGCEGGIEKQCSRCQGLFCALHATPRHETVYVGRRSRQRYLSLCSYCWDRRKIWNKQ